MLTTRTLKCPAEARQAEKHSMSVPASRKDGGRERGLERDMVVAAALQLLDEVGFSGLTLRPTG
jgi:hypothetical protein